MPNNTVLFQNSNKINLNLIDLIREIAMFFHRKKEEFNSLQVLDIIRINFNDEFPDITIYDIENILACCKIDCSKNGQRKKKKKKSFPKTNQNAYWPLHRHNLISELEKAGRPLLPKELKERLLALGLPLSLFENSRYHGYLTCLKKAKKIQYLKDGRYASLEKQ